MANVLLPILAGTLPSDYCFAGWQKLLVDFSNLQQAQLDGMAFYNYGSTKPAPEFQIYPWFRTTDGRWYYFDGNWIAPHPITSTDVLWMWSGDTTSLETFDGGTAGVVTPRSGPMWEVATEFAGRSPMGVGDISGSDPAKTLALDEDYGAGSTKIIANNLPSTDLFVKARGAEGTDLDPALQRFLADYNSPGSGSGTLPEINMPVVSASGSANMDVPINNVHPVRGIYVIRRTARQMYVIP